MVTVQVLAYIESTVSDSRESKLAYLVFFNASIRSLASVVAVVKVLLKEFEFMTIAVVEMMPNIAMSKEEYGNHDFDQGKTAVPAPPLEKRRRRSPGLSLVVKGFPLGFSSHEKSCHHCHIV